MKNFIVILCVFYFPFQIYRNLQIFFDIEFGSFFTASIVLMHGMDICINTFRRIILFTKIKLAAFFTRSILAWFILSIY